MSPHPIHCEGPFPAALFLHPSSVPCLHPGLPCSHKSKHVHPSPSSATSSSSSHHHHHHFHLHPPVAACSGLSPPVASIIKRSASLSMSCPPPHPSMSTPHPLPPCLTLNACRSHDPTCSTSISPSPSDLFNPKPSCPKRFTAHIPITGTSSPHRSLDQFTHSPHFVSSLVLHHHHQLLQRLNHRSRQISGSHVQDQYNHNHHAHHQLVRHHSTHHHSSSTVGYHHPHPHRSVIGTTTSSNSSAESLNPNTFMHHHSQGNQHQHQHQGQHQHQHHHNNNNIITSSSDQSRMMRSKMSKSHVLPLGVKDMKMNQLDLHKQKVEQEVLRKRMYRVGLNLFNQDPQRGIQYIVDHGFTTFGTPNQDITTSTLDPFLTSEQHEQLASSIAHFLLTRKGLSKQMVGEYLGNLQNPLNQLVTDHFISMFDFTGLEVDGAIRKFQTSFQLPGEAQKIQSLLEKFSQRFVDCNPKSLTHARTCGDPNSITSSSTSTSTSSHCDKPSTKCPKPDLVQSSSSLSSSGSSTTSTEGMGGGDVRLTTEDIFMLAFAIIILNVDLHSPNVKVKINASTWIKNLNLAIEGREINESYLMDIYNRIKADELKTGSDHMSQVVKMQQQLVAGNTRLTGQVPNLPVPSRRLVCYCRVFEVYDVLKKDKPGQHLREVYLFNDLFLITKLHKKSTAGFTSSSATPCMQYRGSFSLAGLDIEQFDSPYYKHGLRIRRSYDQKVLFVFNARNEHDQVRFSADLREAIEECNLMVSFTVKEKNQQLNNKRSKSLYDISGATTTDATTGTHHPKDPSPVPVKDIVTPHSLKTSATQSNIKQLYN